MQTQQNPSGPIQVKAVLSWVAFICAALAVSMEVFLHRSRSFGTRYIGLQGAAALPIILVYTMFWPGHDVSLVLDFLIAYVVMCFFARIGVIARIRQSGPREHSRYNGTPRLMRVMRRLSERTVKLAVEPILVFTVGTLILPTSEPLGFYFMLGAFGLLVSVYLSDGFDGQRAYDMHDAFLDQRQIVERFRSMRGDRF